MCTEREIVRRRRLEQLRGSWIPLVILVAVATFALSPYGPLGGIPQPYTTQVIGPDCPSCTVQELLDEARSTGPQIDLYISEPYLREKVVSIDLREGMSAKSLVKELQSQIPESKASIASKCAAGGNLLATLREAQPSSRSQEHWLRIPTADKE